MDCREIIEKLKAEADPAKVAGMAKFGINSKNTLGVSIPFLRKTAKEIGKDHSLAMQLWDSRIHEACILAALVEKPGMVTEKQIESWVKDFNSWDVCDQVCSNLFDKTPFAYTKAIEWSGSDREFVKRAGYVLMACLAVHDKKAEDKKFMKFFPLIVKGATDERNFVKKAVNWALRQIGKRNSNLNREAVETAEKIQLIPLKSARWIASDALREFKLKSGKL